MNTRVGVVALAVVVCGVGATAATQAREERAKAGATLVPSDQLKWTDVPDMAGVKMASVEGDPSKGPHHTFFRLPRGVSLPLHHHTSDHYATVVAGTMVFTVDGQENRLPAGSFFAFTGKTKHSTRCDAAADCVVFVDGRGKWDVVPDQARAQRPSSVR